MESSESLREDETNEETINNTVTLESTTSNTGLIPEIPESAEPKISVLSDRPEVTQQVDDAGIYEEIEEEYEEQVEEDGEIKVVIKKRTVRVEKLPHKHSNNAKEEENEQEEEYEEEELDENGEIKIVTKKRTVKLVKTDTNISAISLDTVQSFIEQEEEYEEEEVDDNGDTIIVKKTRFIKVPKDAPSRESPESYEELEEEYEEEEIQENGDIITVTKTRIIKIPKKGKESNETQSGSVEAYDDDNMYESGEVLQESVEEEDELGTELDKAEKEDISGDSDEEEEKAEKEKKTRGRRQRRKSKSSSKDSLDNLKEEAEEKAEEETLETIREDEEKIVTKSIHSAELKLVDEREAIAQQFDILIKLRLEHVNLKKKNFFLTSKLVQYFKKQKMDHVFTETKEDSDVEQRFYKKLLLFHESNQQIAEEKLRINTEWESQRIVNEDLAEQVKMGWEELMAHKKDIMVKLIDAKTGRTVLHDKTGEDLLLRQENQLKQLLECRLIQIKLQRRIQAKKEERQMDHMGGDFRLMDYEKLSSLKEYYVDKITERDIEIGEMRQKLAAMEDNLEHVKELLRNKEEEMEQQQLRLQRASAELNRRRENLNKIKVSRHKTEKNTAKIKQQSGLLAYPILVRDYEEKTQHLKDLTAQIDSLKHVYRSGVIRIRKLREIIRKKSRSKFSAPSSSILT